MAKIADDMLNNIYKCSDIGSVAEWNPLSISLLSKKIDEKEKRFNDLTIAELLNLIVDVEIEVNKND